MPAATPEKAVGSRQSAIGKTRLPNADCRSAVLFLLPRDRLGRTLAGARIGMRALTADRQRAAMAQAAIGAKVHQPLDVHRHLAAEIAFDLVVAVDRLTDRQHLGVRQLVDATLHRNADLLHDLLGEGRADAMDVLQRDHDALVGWDVDASNTGHAVSP